MTRKFLAREVEFLLDEFDAPDLGTLFRRFLFWLYFIATVTAILLGLVAIYNTFGWQAASVIVFLLIMAAFQMERRVPVYWADDEPWATTADRLPPPGGKALRAPGPRQISRGQRPSLSNPKSEGKHPHS